MKRTKKVGTTEARDTGSVVHTVQGYAVTGRMRTSGNYNAKNNMVSANASRRRK